MLYTISLCFHSKYFSKYFTERIIPLYQLATVVIVRTWSMVSLAFKVGWMKIMQSYGKFCADYEYVCRKSQNVVEIVINKFFKQFLKNWFFRFENIFPLRIVERGLSRKG